MSVRSRRQVRRLRLDTPFRLRPPVHNAEVAERKRTRAAWRAADRTPWPTFDLRPYLAAFARMAAAFTAMQEASAQSPATMAVLREGTLKALRDEAAAAAFRAVPYTEYFVFDETHEWGPGHLVWARDSEACTRTRGAILSWDAPSTEGAES